ncbi:MAG: lysostaphin resistance A-like protein [Planctomycetota bacterium]
MAGAVQEKMDKRTIYAFIAIILAQICLWFFWPFARENILWLRPLFHYRRLVVATLIVGAAVFILEKAGPSTIGLTIGNWKRTVVTTALTAIYTFLVGYLVTLFWKQLGHVRVDGDKVYFLGNIIPYKQIGPAAFCVLLLGQIATVALPEEIIYRGYFQSRLNYSWKPLYAILGSTILFGLVHLDRPLMLLHLVLIGPAWGCAYHYSKSIFPSVIVHCLANVGVVFIIRHIALS